MKKILFVGSIILGLLFSSCMKDNIDVTLTEVNDGNLKLSVTSKDGAPIVEQKVTLNSYSGIIEEKNTNSSGVVEFKDILMGSYQIVLEDVVENNKEYLVVQTVQVVNGTTKEYDIVPSEYSGSIELTVYDANYNIIEGLNLAVIKYEGRLDENFDVLLENTMASAKSDEDGKVVIDNLPLGMYSIFAYIDETDFRYESYAFSIDRKGAVVKGNFYFR